MMPAILFWPQNAEESTLVWNFLTPLSGNIDNNDIISLSKSMLLGYNDGVILKMSKNLSESRCFSSMK